MGKQELTDPMEYLVETVFETGPTDLDMAYQTKADGGEYPPFDEFLAMKLNQAHQDVADEKLTRNFNDEKGGSSEDLASRTYLPITPEVDIKDLALRAKTTDFIDSLSPGDLQVVLRWAAGVYLSQKQFSKNHV